MSHLPSQVRAAISMLSDALESLAEQRRRQAGEQLSVVPGA
jgi:hypothetical protein